MSSTQRPDPSSQDINDAIFECVEKITAVWEAAGLNAESEAELLSQEIDHAVTQSFDRLLTRRGWAINHLKRGARR